MDRWPQFKRVAGEIGALREKLIDMYWDARSAEMNARTVLFYPPRQARRPRHRLGGAGGGRAWLRAAQGGAAGMVRRVGRPVMGSAYLVAVYLPDSAWHAYDRSPR